MTIEDKAKLYDEALKKAKDVIEQNPLMEYLKKGIEYILPELKESEDERIRKALIRTFNELKTNQHINSVLVGNILTWLEKQGKQEEPQVYDTEDGGIITYSETDGYQLYQPKFKVGDWILYSGDHYEGVRHITKIDENGYYIERNGLPHGIIPFNHEICMRLWTIQDAKDGDILYSPSLHLIWIYKDNKEVHAGINMNYASSLSIGTSIVIPNDACLATKLQRDTLFAKIHEAGYEWDAEKKELKKIEQKSVEWSEEDKVILDEIIDFFENGTVKLQHDLSLYASWLKSLKDRVLPQPKQEWSEEDENLLKLSFENLTELKDRFGKDYGRVGDCINWLKSLKDRCTWSPSDEQLEAFENFVRGIWESCYDSPYENNAKLLYSLLEQLKKLKD